MLCGRRLQVQVNKDKIKPPNPKIKQTLLEEAKLRVREKREAITHWTDWLKRSKQNWKSLLSSFNYL